MTPEEKKRILKVGGPIGIVLCALSGYALNALVLDDDARVTEVPACSVVGWQQVPDKCVCVPGVILARPGEFTACPHPRHVSTLRDGQRPWIECECPAPNTGDEAALVRR